MEATKEKVKLVDGWKLTAEGQRVVDYIDEKGISNTFTQMRNRVYQSDADWMRAYLAYCEDLHSQLPAVEDAPKDEDAEFTQALTDLKNQLKESTAKLIEAQERLRSDDLEDPEDKPKDKAKAKSKE